LPMKVLIYPSFGTLCIYNNKNNNNKVKSKPL
jgi:hypothetical protein